MQFHRCQQEQIIVVVAQEQLYSQEVVVQELITGMLLQLEEQVYQPQPPIPLQVFLPPLLIM